MIPVDPKGDLSASIPERLKLDEDVHYMVVPLNPTEEPTPQMVAGLAVACFGHLPRIADRLKASETFIDEWDGQRVLVTWLSRWPIDPPKGSTAADDDAYKERILAMLTPEQRQALADNNRAAFERATKGPVQ
ncbi:MAG TPA: hypothetical protein VMU02_05810 [bacterium]|nr:hypothetical protein [bacterium]